MKKNMKKNKNKYLLIGLSIPAIISIFSIEDIYANEIPTLKIYNSNGSPKLEWVTEMLEENVLIRTSFEETDKLLPKLNTWTNQYINLHGFSNEDSFSGDRAYVLNDNSDNKGTYYNSPATKSNYHVLDYDRLQFDNGTKLSVSFKAKSIGSSEVQLYGDGGQANSFNYFNTKFAKNAVIGDNVLYVEDASVLKEGNTISLDTDVMVVTSSYTIKSIDLENNSITLNNKIRRNIDYKTEGNLKTRPWRWAFSFPNRKINSSNWETYNINTTVNNHNDFDVAVRGGRIYMPTATNGKLMIDDVKFGYATEVEVFKEGTSIYKGYLSDFHDTSVKDTIKPNTVNKINTTISNDFKINFVPVKPLDTGIKKSYTIQAIAKNGSRSEMSSPQEIIIGGEVVKYKYTINSNKNTPTTLANTTNNLEFNLSMNQLNLENDYIHIQAIDAANNVSAITTYKLKDIVDMNKVNNLYDSLNKVENSMNYNEFIQFIEEVESMYGTNIPLDVKNRIQELASYHNANTAFLLLLEGDFILTTSDITSFGKTKLTAKKQILYTNFAKEFNIIDARGTQQGYSITVSATPFIEDTFAGFIGQPVQLPIGTLALNPVNEVQQIGLVHNTQKPTPQTINSTIIDSGSVNVLQAGKGQGMGEFVFNFGDKPLSMVVDSTTAKIDNVNYPSGITPYTSTITWNLITGP